MPWISTSNQKNRRDMLDYLLYTIAGAVIAAITFSFLLWLRF